MITEAVGDVVMHQQSPELVYVLEAPDRGWFSAQMVDAIRRGAQPGGRAVSATVFILGTKGWGEGRVVYRIGEEHNGVHQGTRLA